MEYDLEKMSLEDLRNLRGQIDRAITGYSERKRREAMAAAEEVVKAHGFSSLADVTGTRRRNTRGGKSAARPAEEPRYANPDDPNQTWSGRGRRPRWIQEALASGRPLEDFTR